MDLDEEVSPEPEVPPPESFIFHAFCKDAMKVFVTGKRGYKGGSVASGRSAGTRDEGKTVGGNTESGAGTSGPDGEELRSDINGPVALS